VHRYLLVLICLIGLAGCSTVTVRPDDSNKNMAAPDYEDTRHFFFWGLAGEEHVDVSEICAGREPEQMQTQQTFMNGFLGAITLGIYAPHSVKVWCGQPDKQETAA